MTDRRVVIADGSVTELPVVSCVECEQLRRRIERLERLLAIVADSPWMPADMRSALYRYMDAP